MPKQHRKANLKKTHSHKTKKRLRKKVEMLALKAMKPSKRRKVMKKKQKEKSDGSK